MTTDRPAEPTTVIAIYRVQEGKQDAFLELLRQHHPTLLEVGLATEDEPVVYCGQEQRGGPIVFEIFTWKYPDSSRIAHETPAVTRIWEAMGTLVEERDGKPEFEFPHVELVDLGA